ATYPALRRCSGGIELCIACCLLNVRRHQPWKVGRPPRRLGIAMPAPWLPPPRPSTARQRPAIIIPVFDKLGRTAPHARYGARLIGNAVYEGQHCWGRLHTAMHDDAQWREDQGQPDGKNTEKIPHFVIARDRL